MEELWRCFEGIKTMTDEKLDKKQSIVELLKKLAWIYKK
jgi:hypothetical protein